MKIRKRVFALTLVLVMILACISSLAVGDTVELPKALKVIEEEAFSNDTSIENVILPIGLAEIQREAFANSSLTEINLPNTLTSIGDEAFFNTSLRDVFLPASLRYISPSAFSNIEDIHFTSELDCYAMKWCESNGYPVNVDWKDSPYLYATKSGGGVQLIWNVDELADNYVISERINGKLTEIATVGATTKYTISSVSEGTHTYVVQPTKVVNKKTVTGHYSNYIDYQNVEEIEIEPITPSISVNHPILGDIFAAGTFEMFNGKAHQTWTVTANCAWTLTKSGNWFTVDTTSGAAGTTTVVLNIDDGAAAGETRTGSVTFKIAGKSYKTVNFRQVGSDKSLTITHPTLGDIIAASPIEMHNGAAHQTWTITSNAAWKLTKTGTWFTIDNNVTSGDAGTTTIVLRMTDGADPGERRTGTLKFYFGNSLYKTVTITQDGGVDTDPATSISVVHPWIGDVIGAGSANLTNSTGQSSNWTVFANFDWTITTSGSWFTVSPTSGSANVKTNVKITTTGYASSGYNTGSIIFKKGSSKKATIKLYQGEGYDPADNDDSFTVNHPYLGNVLDQDTIYMHNGSSYQTWSVVSNVDWSLTKSGSWFTVSPTSGSAKSATDVKLSFSSGVPAGESRDGYVKFSYYINGRKKTSTVYIAQDGGPVEPTPKSSLAVTHALLGDVFSHDDGIEMHNGTGAEQNWSVVSNKSWNIVTTGNWYSVSRTSGSANTDTNPSTNLKITITDYARPGTKNTGTITFYVDGVKDRTVSIYQDGGEAAEPSMTIGSPEFGDVLTLDAISFDNTMRTYDFTIKANRAWSSSKSGSWFTVDTLSGNADAQYTVKVTVTSLPSAGQQFTGSITYKVDGATYKTVNLKVYTPTSGSDEYVFKYLSNSVWTSDEYKKSTYYQNLVTLDKSLTGSAANASGLISVAKSQSGYHEGDSPESTDYSALQGNTSGSNNFTEYMCSFNGRIITTGLSDQAWCAYFVTWCARRAGISTNLISNFSGCTPAVNATLPSDCNAVIYTKDLAGSWTPSKGDLIFFTGTSAGYSGHVGIVDSVSGTTVTYHDGNGGGSNKVRTGATVSIWGSSVYGYAHINYAGTQNGSSYEPHRVLALYDYHCKGPDVQWVQNKLKTLGYYTDTVDGDYGAKTELAVKAFQKANNLTVDGTVGSATLNALKSGTSTAKPDSDPVTSITKATMIANLNASSVLGGKKDACVKLAGLLWDAGFPPAYIAGVLGNIMHEGSQGQFENIMGYTLNNLLSAYPGLKKISDGGKSHQNYIAHMKGFTDYDGCGHSHTDYTPYSNKKIYDSGMSLKAVDTLLTKYKGENWNARFGLGMIQWTADRTIGLMKYYHSEAGTADNITLAQCLTAEMKYCTAELLDGWYGTFSTWNSKYASETNAAYIAGVLITQQYIKPGGTHYATVGSSMLSEYSIDKTRGNSAAAIYKAMIGQ